MCDSQPRAGTRGRAAPGGTAAQPCTEDLVLPMGCKQHPELHQQRQPAPRRGPAIPPRHAQHTGAVPGSQGLAGGRWCNCRHDCPVSLFASQRLGCLNPGFVGGRRLQASARPSEVVCVSCEEKLFIYREAGSLSDNEFWATTYSPLSVEGFSILWTQYYM